MPLSVLGPSVGSSIFRSRFRSRTLAVPLTRKLPSFLGCVITDTGDGVGGEFADHFFENIFQGGQTLNIAVFIYHQADASAFTLEVQQLTVQWRVFRDEQRFP